MNSVTWKYLSKWMIIQDTQSYMLNHLKYYVGWDMYGILGIDKIMFFGWKANFVCPFCYKRGGKHTWWPASNFAHGSNWSMKEVSYKHIKDQPNFFCSVSGGHVISRISRKVRGILKEKMPTGVVQPLRTSSNLWILCKHCTWLNLSSRYWDNWDTLEFQTNFINGILFC